MEGCIDTTLRADRVRAAHGNDRKEFNTPASVDGFNDGSETSKSSTNNNDFWFYCHILSVFIKLVKFFSRGTDAAVMLLASSVSFGTFFYIASTRLSQMPPARKISPVCSKCE